MKSYMKAALMCGCLPILAACGGSDNGSSPTRTLPVAPVVPVIPTVSFPSSGLIGSGAWTTNDLLNLAGAKAAFDQGVTDAIIQPGIPAVASATYNGTIAFTAPTRQPKEFYGRMTMGIDFGAGTLSGQATDFGLAKNTTGSASPLTPLSGSMAFRRSNITGPNFTTAMEGQLGGVGGPYVIRTELAGTVYTNGTSSVIEGTVTGDMSSDVIDVMPFSSGQFLATE